MARYRYKYNPKSLVYEKVPYSTKDYFWWAAKALAVVLVVATASIYIFDKYFESPELRDAKRENEFLQEEIDVLSDEMNQMAEVLSDIEERDDEIYRSIFGTSPYPEHLRNPGIGGSNRFKDYEGYSNSDMVIDAKKQVSKLQRTLVAQSKSFQELYDLARTKSKMLAHIPAIQPVRNEDLKRMASGYGRRIDPIYGVIKMHWGMDFTAPTGTEIFATGDGEVVRVQRKTSGYGKNVIIKHGFGYETLYAHMSEIKVRVGQKVKRGEVIGLIGNTGKSVGPHLHYEVIKDGKKVNPALFYFNDLTPEQYQEMLDKADVAGQSFD
ncbi:MAG: M23 family metallopeptidase [Flavobacteriales bacterium]|nr:M23 family metallopeptidase [Flavobacteriales bacterium]